jgi:HD-GYP domain-containing protein (c-di-GMP phosphodiesterase class II)
VDSLQKVPVDLLKIGMYVTELDRPWLETPFLFQGFYIRDEDEIAEIKAHCAHVFVTRETLPDDFAAPAEPDATPVNGKTVSDCESKPRDEAPADEEVVDLDPGTGGVRYIDKTTLKEEMRTAAGVHKQAIAAVHGVMDELRRSGSLDLRRLESTVTPMVDSVLRNPAALACLVRMQKKDDYLYHHSLASSVWATILGRQIGLTRDDLALLSLGAMVLDVGKTLVPDEILSKPDQLRAEETKLMQQHVKFGLDILQQAGDVDPRVLDMVAYHHERYNGTGYPAGCSGSDIPVFGRIAGIVDAYDAMITLRPYAKPVSSYGALRKLQKLADVEFQAEIVEQFTRAIGVFPTGTLIELNSGEVGIVTKQNRIRRLRPEIMLIMAGDKQLLENFRVIDLNSETVGTENMKSLWIERGLEPGAHGIDPTEFYLD